MHPPSFFGPYTPPGGNPYSYHLHSAVRPPAPAPFQASPTTKAPPYRPGKPYFPSPPDPEQTSQKALGPVPRPGPARPHWPPPLSPPEEALVPAYSASAPPPAYSPQRKDDQDQCRCDLGDEDEYERDDDGGPKERARKVVILLLTGMNVLVWGTVFYFWIQDNLMDRLWAEVQAEGGTRFQI